MQHGLTVGPEICPCASRKILDAPQCDVAGRSVSSTGVKKVQTRLKILNCILFNVEGIMNFASWALHPQHTDPDIWALEEGTLGVTTDANDELLPKEIKEVASINEMLQPERASLQFIGSYCVALDLGTMDVVCKGRFKHEVCLRNISCHCALLDSTFKTGKESLGGSYRPRRCKLVFDSVPVSNIKAHYILSNQMCLIPPQQCISGDRNHHAVYRMDRG